MDFTNVQSKKFWSLSGKEVAGLLGVNIKEGLTQEEIKNRIQFFGRNTFETSRTSSKFKIFLNQLKSPLILVLIFAGLVTLAISHFRDSIFIFIAVVVNSLLGFWQENKAERALAELKTYLKQRTRVLREGKEREIDAEEVVPGDIVRLSQGDRVPADARIIFANDFQVDESILTGESLPVAKSEVAVLKSAVVSDQTSMIFAGTLVTQGVGSAIVCRTDASTELGKIASFIAQSQNEKTPLQKAITNFSVYLSIFLGALTFLVFIIGIFSGQPFLDMFLTSVAIAVSAIPEGLPISMTVILAVGVERMAKRKGVVRRLIAAEALGSTTVILTDKTGTLTMAKMVLSKIISLSKTSEEKMMTYALSNANVLIENPEDSPKDWRMNGRIMEVAVVRSLALRGVPVSKILDKSKVLEIIPFNAVQKFSASLVKESRGYAVILFGAPDILLEHSFLSVKKKKEILNQISDLASSGERVLGVATKKIKSIKDFSLTKNFKTERLSFEGLITFRDPVRPGIKDAIRKMQDAGIKTVILTGDHRGTAVAVAREVGMNYNDEAILEAKELEFLSDGAIKDRLSELSVIARVTPFDKLRIAKLFQESGEIVAMTGDGVNDAPSIKQANVGIAMGSGTEVAQSVSDLVLLDDNFETIVSAVEEGRQIFGNIRKVLVYLLSNVTDGLILIGGSLLLGVPLPLNALQILWVNFFSGSFPAIAFAFEKDADSLSHRPHGKNMSLFNPLMKFLILIIGLSTSAFLFILYILLLKLGYSEDLVRTFTFAAFGTYTLLVSFSVRSLNQSILSYPLLSNNYLNFGVIIGIFLMALSIYIPLFQNIFGTVPLPLVWVLGVAFIGVFNIILIELTKLFFRKRSEIFKTK